MSIPSNAAIALAWWVKKQGQPLYRILVKEGDVVVVDTPTFQKIVGDGVAKIREWIADGIPQPTDDEVIQICKDYDAFVEQQKLDEAAKVEEEKSKKAAVIAKLGLTEEEGKALLT